MPKNQTLVEDMVTLGGNILGNLMGARHDMHTQTKQRMESVMRRLNMVSREEFDTAFSMLAKTRLMQEELSGRLSKIEAHLNLSSAKPAMKTKKSNLPSVKKDKQRTRRK